MVEINMLRRAQTGFSLIELMCVLAIILVLVGLMLGPVTRAYHKARNLGWENDAYQLADRFRDKMRQHFGETPEYPALTVEQLYDGGMIDGGLRGFLKDKRVEYFPFSSKAPDETVILRVTISKRAWYVVQKGEIKPPKE